MKEYKSVTFNAGITTKKHDAKFQAILDEHSKEGWELHSFDNFGGTVMVVFQKEKDVF